MQQHVLEHIHVEVDERIAMSSMLGPCCRREEEEELVTPILFLLLGVPGSMFLPPLYIYGCAGLCVACLYVYGLYITGAD